jgi:D-arginine dehydrogenase
VTLGLPARADVVIVGGGFAGAATAWALSRYGDLDIVLLEREEGFGYHASGRNAALGRQLVEDERFTDLTVRGAEFLRAPPPDFGEEPLWRPVGSMLLADTEAEVEALGRRAQSREIACERIPIEAVWERLPMLRGAAGAGGIYVPGDGVIDVHALLMGFLRGARRRGTHLALACEVLGVDRERGRDSERLRVITGQGEVSTRSVVAAGGAWAGQVAVMAGARDPGLVPIRRHLFVTEPIAGLDVELPFVWHLGADEFYVRPEGSGLLLSACDEEATEPGQCATQPMALEALAEKLARAAPELASLGVARAWACQRTFAPSRRPIIDWDADVPGVFWVAGLGGHGATSSAAIGAEAAAAIAARLI